VKERQYEAYLEVVDLYLFNTGKVTHRKEKDSNRKLGSQDYLSWLKTRTGWVTLLPRTKLPEQKGRGGVRPDRVLPVGASCPVVMSSSIVSTLAISKPLREKKI